ncbi:hypothetical protein Q5530_12780 [Saccharothrix sp. BKS2]|uniref:hypothetical protein n=1 Tax=Saccharothrix sp. BKS2 TaxID=3064400 RepID=UPI0039E93542
MINETTRTTSTPIGIAAHVSSTERFHDPVEHLDFARPMAENYLPYDSRSEAELRTAAFEEETALERERALWELADRQGAGALPAIQDYVDREPDGLARSGALWLGLKSAGAQSAGLLESHRDDDDPEVADWARVLYADATATAPNRVYGVAEVEETGNFDQTVPLIISGYTTVVFPELGAVRVVLSPKWFDSIMGRVLASTNVRNFQTDLTIEKMLEGLHDDGTPHYEIYPFRGFSVEYDKKYWEHNYLSQTLRDFYPSGIVEQGEAVQVPISLERIAFTELAPKGTAEILGQGERADRIRGADFGFVQSVRGRYFGWAAVNLQAAVEAGRVTAGHVQLSNPTDPVSGPMTNAKLFGTFRGKSGDYLGKGHMTLNHVKCHGKADGTTDVVGGR